MKRIFIFFLFIFFNLLFSYGHPHVFVDTYVTFVFSSDFLEGIQVKWVFDDFYSTAVLLDYDTDFNQELDNNEINEIYNYLFIPYKQFHFFSYIELKPDSYIAELPAEISQERFKEDILNHLNFPDQHTYIKEAYQYDESENLYKLKEGLSETELKHAMTVLNYVEYIEITDFNASTDRDGKLIYSFFIPYRVKISNTEQYIKVSQYDQSYFVSLKFTEPDYFAVSGESSIRYSLFYQNESNHSVFGEIDSYEVILSFRSK